MFKVYQLTCSDKNLIYYGHTKQTLAQRKRSHKYDCKKGVVVTTLPMWEAGGVEIATLYTFNNLKEAQILENKFINTMPCINVNSANKRDKNKAKENSARYHNNNKEERNRRNKIRRDLNKDKYNAARRAKYALIHNANSLGSNIKASNM